MDFFNIFSQYGFILSPLLTGIGLVIMGAGLGAFVKRSRENGLIEADRQRTQQLQEENNHLIDKNNYLVKKNEEIHSDLQRQINHLSREVGDIFTRLSSPQVRVSEQYIKPVQPVKPLIEADDDEPEFQLPRTNTKPQKKVDSIGRQIVDDVLSDYNKNEII